MNEIIEVLKGLVAHAENGAFAIQAVDTLDRLQKSADEEGVNGLLQELKEAFNDNDTITKAQFEEWQAKANELVAEDVEEVEKEEVVEEAEVTKEAEVVEEVEVVEAAVEPEEPVAKSEEIEPEVVEVEEDIQKSLSVQIEKQAIELKKAQADFKKAQKEIETLRVEKQKSELIEKASKELSYLGKGADEVGDLLMSLRLAGVPDEIFAGLYGLLKSNSEMIKESGFFSEFGTSIEPDNTDPEAKMMKSAKELVEKGEFPTVPSAFAHLYKANPGALEE